LYPVCNLVKPNVAEHGIPSRLRLRSRPFRAGRTADKGRIEVERVTVSRNLAIPPSEADELDAFDGDPDFMLSLARGMLIFRAFAEERRKLTIAQMAAATGLKRSTAYRCLYTLTKLGYLESEGTQFMPRASTLTLGSAYFARGRWEAALQPILDGLRDRLGMTCALGSYDDGHIYYVVVSQSLGSLTLVASVGRRLPAYCTAVGRVFLADLDDAALETYVEGLTPIQYTPNTATDRQTLVRRIEDVRRDQYAVASQEIDLGVRALAVPIRFEGEVVAALMTGGEISVLTDEKLKQEFLPQLQKAASEIGMLWRNLDR
jgi:IclR family pca regulon transcriptional regulator